jgi:transposase-like protein
MPHHNQSIQERVIALVEEGTLTAAEAGRRYGVPDRTARRWIERYRENGKTSRRAGTGFGRVSSQAADSRLVDEARENPFLNSVQLKRNTAFPGCQKIGRTALRRLDLDLEARL